jgi:hypothetical protein
MFPPWYPAQIFRPAAAKFGRTSEEVEAVCGSNPAILDRLETDGFAAAREYCAGSLSTWLADLTADDVKRLVELCSGPQAGTEDDVRLAPLISRSSQTRLISGLDRNRLCATVTGGWPAGTIASAERFAMRVGNELRPLWVDRYFGAHPRELITFLNRLHSLLGPRQLRLFGSEGGIASLTTHARDLLRQSAAVLGRQGFEIEWRIAADPDLVNLHGRQLHLAQNGTAYGIPPVDRVLGTAPIGNETDSLLFAVDIDDIEAAWLRAIVFI